LLYVDDAAEAFVLAAERYDGADPVNVGTGRETTIRELAGMIGGLMGYRGQFVFNADKPNGQPRRCLDVRRAADRFGFTAATTLEDGLARTIAWWRSEGSQIYEKEPGPS
jgi:GDP-L-fucose synthase